METEKTYQECPNCGQRYYNNPEVPFKERKIDLCKICLEEALLEDEEEDTK